MGHARRLGMPATLVARPLGQTLIV